MTGNDFDWMVWNHAVREWKAPVKASVSGVSLLQLSPIFPSIPFSPETPDTQAKKVLVITTRDCYILSGSFTTHMSQISAVTWNWACSLSLWTKSYHIHIERKYPFDISFKCTTCFPGLTLWLLASYLLLMVLREGGRCTHKWAVFQTRHGVRLIFPVSLAFAIFSASKHKTYQSYEILN